MIDERLRQLAEKYETADFLPADPSFFMHQVSDPLDQETLAFIASSLSYGSRKQFFPKIQFVLDNSGGKVFEWVKDGLFKSDIPDDMQCYYRLYTNHTMYQFLSALQSMILEFGSIKNFIVKYQSGAGEPLTGYSAVVKITSYFSSKGIEVIIPKNATSACKRICMFLRWMVRDNSPVDLGLWSDIIDKRSLIMPLDTHVLQQSVSMGLLKSRTGSMSTALRLTERMSQIFPDDPLKGDFALFGYGVNS